MRGKNRVYKAALCIAVMLACSFRTAWAEQEAEPVGFSVKAVQSGRQVNKRVSYFDLMLSPGEEHLLEIDVFNTSDNPLNVSVTANTAGTNSGGVIDYTLPNVTDESLQASFGELADVDAPYASIPPNSSQRVGINIKMPEEPFDGVMLGGVAVRKAEEKEAAAEGSSIQNEYCYIIAVKIRENDTAIEPELRLRNVGPKLSNYHTSIAANLQNYRAAIAKGMNIEAAVYYNNGEEPLYTSSADNFDVAPNSSFDYIIPCAGKLSPGTYRLAMSASLEDKRWEFDETFVVSGAAADDINTQAVNAPGIDYYKIATICLALLLIAILALFAVRRTYARRDKYNKTEDMR